MPRRSYIYYSDRKILEQKAQVPPSRWRRASRRVAGVGVTVFGNGGNIDLRPEEPEPILRDMQNLWMDLGQEGRIGTFDEPRDYFYGTLAFYYDVYDTVNPPVFFLVGATDSTIVALGGSPEHLRGFRGRQIRPVSNAPYVVMEWDVAEVIYKAEIPLEDRQRISTPESGGDLKAFYVATMYKDWQSRKGDKVEFEILARKEGAAFHLSPPSVESPMQVIFGSPIFVAQTSDPIPQVGR